MTTQQHKDTIITDSDVRWDMEWDITQFPNKPSIEVIFEPEKALARLLALEVVFLNNHWWEKDWPDDAKKATSLNVNCSDVFGPAADAEEVLYNEIEDLYRHWEKDGVYGPAVWCAKKRGVLPWGRVLGEIEKGGVWNLEKEFGDLG